MPLICLRLVKLLFITKGIKNIEINFFNAFFKISVIKPSTLCSHQTLKNSLNKIMSFLVVDESIKSISMIPSLMH